MVWFHVDDNLAFHNKVVKAGNPAMGAWVRAGSWCTSNLTDGFIPTSVALTLGTGTQWSSLVSSGLIDVADGGYRFHQWEQRQFTKAEVEEKRDYERQRKAEQRKRKRVPPDVPLGQDSGVPPGVPPGHDLDVPQGVPRARAPVTPPHPTPLVETLGGEVSGRKGLATPPPPRYCEDHPGGTRHPCHSCQQARQTYENWVATLTAEHDIVAQATAAAERTERTRAITECDLCNEDGYRGSIVCDHIDRTETARNGAAQVRAALRRTKIKVAPSGDEPF